MRDRLGVSSECEDGSHILMMDFDISHFEFHRIVSRIRKVIDVFNLPSFMIFKTRHGFHAYCLAKMDLKAIEMVYKTFEGLADSKHLEFGNDVCKRYVLRIGDEIKYYMTIRGYAGFYEYTLSRAHAVLLKDIYGCEYYNMQNLNFDDSDILVFEKYTQPLKEAVTHGNI